MTDIANNRRPRIAYVVTASVSVGFLRGHLSHLRRRGFDVFVIASPGDHLDRVQEEGATPIELTMEREISPWKDCVALVRMIRVCQRLRPDVLLAATPKAGLIGMLAAWSTRVPARVFFQLGLRLETARGLKRWLLYGAERVTAACAHRVVCVSDSLRKLYLKLGLCRPSKAVVLASGSANGVDADHFRATPQLEEQAAAIRSKFGIPAEAPVVGFVGRMTRDKGVPELLAAFKKVLAEAPEARLLMVGDFESGDPVPEDCVRELRAHRQIAITGFVEDPAPYFAAMDVFAFPSFREGCGIVVLEASAAGLPIAAFRATGVVDGVVDGVTGTLTPSGDAEALAAVIVRYLKDPELRSKHGQSGHERVQRDYRPDMVREAHYQEYISLLQKAGVLRPYEEPAPADETAVPQVT